MRIALSETAVLAPPRQLSPRRVVGEELGEHVGRQVGDVGAGARVLEPAEERGHVPAVLADRVWRAAIGLDLEEEGLEGILEFHRM